MKPLLLHSCCAPCVTACLDVLRGEVPWQGVLAEAPDFSHFIVYFYNPNIHPESEYLVRASEARRYAALAGAEFLCGEYEPKRWAALTKGLENEPERGARCSVCYDMRLSEAFSLAKQRGAAVATSLTLSPHKNAAEINKIGARLQGETGTPYLASDFKKKGGVARSRSMSQKHCLYCQNYCGCAFSLGDRLLKEQKPLS